MGSLEGTRADVIVLEPFLFLRLFRRCLQRLVDVCARLDFWPEG